MLGKFREVGGGRLEKVGDESREGNESIDAPFVVVDEEHHGDDRGSVERRERASLGSPWR